MRFRTWLARVAGYIPDLSKQTWAVAKGTMEVLSVCILALILVGVPEAVGITAGWSEGALMLLSLIGGILVTPLAAGMITYASSASWEARGARLIDAWHLARIRFRRIVLTGIVAGLIVTGMGWFASMIYSLIGLLPMLLGWIPLLGAAISAIASCVVWLVALAMEFIAHIALVVGMLTLTADGMWGRMQVTRALTIMWGGRKNTMPCLLLLLALWVAVRGLCTLLGWALPGVGMVAGAALNALLTAVSMTAVSVIYLRERDRQEGARFRA